MLKNLVICLFLFTSVKVFAYIPTLDSLLRNANNIEIDRATIIANLQIKLKLNEDNTEQVRVYKYIFNNERENYPVMSQLSYMGTTITEKSLYDLLNSSMMSLRNISKNQENIEQRLYHSLLAMYFRNDSGFMIDFLNENGFSVKRNRNLINASKLSLLRRYESYLRKYKENPDDSSLVNPLKAESVEERALVKKTMQSPLIKEDGLVKLVKSGDYFNWAVEEDRFKASFSYEHRLESLELNLANTTLKVDVGRPLLQNGGFEFPEYINLAVGTEKVYEIKLLSVKLIADNKRRAEKRLSKYRETIKENDIKMSQEKLPITL